MRKVLLITTLLLALMRIVAACDNETASDGETNALETVVTSIAESEKVAVDETKSETTEPEATEPETTEPETDPPAVHMHMGEEWVTVNEPACTTEGNKYFLCSCGEIIESETIPATGHTEETIPAVDATCTASGLTAGKKCTVCG